MARTCLAWPLWIAPSVAVAVKVARMLPPEEYDFWREEGMSMGFKYVASGPLVRSSYKAGEVFMEAFLAERDARRQAAAMAAGAAGPDGTPMLRSAVWSPPTTAAL